MAIIIDLKMQNAGTDRALSRLEKALDRLDAALNRVNKAIAGTAGAVNGLAGNMSAPSGSRGGGGSRSRKPVFNSIQDEIQWLRQQPGWRAQAQADQLQRRMAASSPQGQLQQALMRSRFSFQNGKMSNSLNIMPLGRDLMSSIGPQLMQLMGIGANGGGGDMGVAGAAVPEVAAFTKALDIGKRAMMAFAMAAAAAVYALNTYAKDRVAYGGGSSTFRQARRIAAMTGADMGAFSGNLPGTVGIAGINPVGGPFGDMDYAGKMVRAARFVAQGKSFEDMRRRAAMMGSPELANMANFRPDQRKTMFSADTMSMREGDAKRTAQMMVDLQLAWERLSAAFTRLAGPYIYAAAKMTEWLTALMTKFDQFVKWLQDILGIGDKQGKKSPLDRNTEATDQLTRAMKDVRETLGGGPRAQGALPGKFRNGVSGDLRDLRLANI